MCSTVRLASIFGWAFIFLVLLDTSTAGASQGGNSRSSSPADRVSKEETMKKPKPAEVSTHESNKELVSVDPGQARSKFSHNRVEFKEKWSHSLNRNNEQERSGTRTTRTRRDLEIKNEDKTNRWSDGDDGEHGNPMLWGQDDIANEKRKWGQNKAKVWGKRGLLQDEKRKWGQNRASVWGKRDIDAAENWDLENGEDATRKGKIEDQLELFDGTIENLSERIRRKWGKSKASVWGKRAAFQDDDDEEDNVENEESLEKRKWGSNKAKVWGKRRSDEGVEKRKWGNNKAKVWGKRENDDSLEKRKWGSNKAKVWGKRDPNEDTLMRSNEDDLDILRSWNRLEQKEDEKRKWSSNKAKVWGKRDVTWSSEKRKWGRNSAKVWGKRGLLGHKQDLPSSHSSSLTKHDIDFFGGHQNDTEVKLLCVDEDKVTGLCSLHKEKYELTLKNKKQNIPRRPT